MSNTSAPQSTPTAKGTVAQDQNQPRVTGASRARTLVMNNAIYIVLILLFIGIVLAEPRFLSMRNFGFIMTQSAPRVIIALGVAGILVLGGTDLAAGRMVGMAGILSASLLQAVDYSLRIYTGLPALPLWLPILACIALCAIFSFVQAMLVAVLRIAPFIASLGMQMVVYGVQSIYFDTINKSAPIGGLSKAFSNFAQGSFNVGGTMIPFIVIYAIVIATTIWFIWNKTTLGKHMFAIGGNPEAAVISGVNTTLITVIIYMMAGALYGFAGFLEAGRPGSATNSMGSGYELDAIAACVVGGVSLRGGIGSISGIVTGVLIFQVINYGLVFIGVNPYVQYLIKGVIILFAIAIDTQKYIKRK